MTVVAYRNGTMASDSQCTQNETRILVADKIQRLASGALFGSAGDVDTRDIIGLINRCGVASELPSYEVLEALGCQINCFLVFLSGEGWMISTGKDGGGVYPAWRGRVGYNAIGCGAREALAAMDMGASAVEAVRVACKRNIYCGLPVRWLGLKVQNGSRIRSRGKK